MEHCPNLCIWGLEYEVGREVNASAPLVIMLGLYADLCCTLLSRKPLFALQFTRSSG